MLSALQTLDAQWLEWIRSAFVVESGWFQTLIILLADSEPILFGIFLVCLWLYGVAERNDGPKQVALDLFWHVLGAFALYWILNQTLPARVRPETLTNLPVLISHLPDNSFPSGHALFWGASWWTLHVLLDRPRVTITFFILGFITCLARVIAGIHYPGDIIVGFLLGWAITHILMQLPHGQRYRAYAQDLPIRIARSLSL